MSLLDVAIVAYCTLLRHGHLGLQNNNSCLGTTSGQQLIVPGAGALISLAQGAKNGNLRREEGEESNQQQKTGPELTSITQTLILGCIQGGLEKQW